MAGMTTQTLGLGRKILMDAYVVEAKQVFPLWRSIVGRVYSTTQTSEIITQIIGLGPAEYTPEGEQVRFDDMRRGFSQEFKPFTVTKGMRYTKLLDATLQYRDILARQPEFANSYGKTRNQFATNLLNLGFTNTTMGMNSETLFSTSHATAVPGVVQSNLITGALSPTTIEAALAVLRRQKDPLGQVMGVTGKIKLIVPPELEWAAKRYCESPKMATVPNNDINPFSQIVEWEVNPYLTSPTAWFMIAQDPKQNGLFMMEQMAYDFEKLQTTLDMFVPWISWESYIPGWKDWRGTVASTGL